MQETLRLLRGLQEIDVELYRVKEELRRLPAERDRRRARIDEQKHRLAEIERRQQDARAKVKEIEDMTTMQRQRIKKLEGESSKARDTAMVVAFQHEMRSLKRDISEAEEEGLRLVEEADEVEGQGSELRAAIEAAEAEFEEYAANVAGEIRASEEKRAALEEDRASRMGPMPPEILSEYEKLLDARAGQAIALLENRICQGCFVNVPSNIYVRLARGTELVTCPSCGRILHLPGC